MGQRSWVEGLGDPSAPQAASARIFPALMLYFWPPADMVLGVRAKWLRWPTTASVAWVWPTMPELEVGVGLSHPPSLGGAFGWSFSLPTFHPASAFHFPTVDPFGHMAIP